MAPKSQLLPHRSVTEEKEKEKEKERKSSSDEDSETESSGEENSSDESEEGSSEDEADPKTLSSNKPQIPVARSEPNQIPKKNGWISDPDSESESPNYQLQPIGKLSAQSSAKRTQREVDATPEPPSSKKLKAEEKTPSVSGACIVRLWSDKDEITVLKGMIEFRKLEGQDPNSERFYNFIKGKLQDNFSKEQLRTKIGRMKKRFVNVMKKAAENGADPVFSKPHESMTFELCKKIWGENMNNRPLSSKKEKAENAKKDKIEKNAANDVMKAEKADDVMKAEKANAQSDMNEEKVVEGDFWSKYPNLSMSFQSIVGKFPSVAMTEAGACFLKERVSLIGDAKAKEFDEKWRQLIVEEAELNHKMLSLMTEQVRVALNK